MPDAKSRHLIARWIGRIPIRVWGLTVPERLRLALVQAGVWDSGDWSGSVPEDAGGVLLLLADHVYDNAVLRALARAPGTGLDRGDGRMVAAHVAPAEAAAMARTLADNAPAPPGLTVLRPAELAPAHRAKLRKREEPFVLPVTGATRRAVENRLFEASYKGVTDVITKYVWPLPARAVTRLCVRLGITPNAVTLVGLVLAVAAFVLFADGWLWSGLVCGWAMTFLDTVDGKLARVTLTSSRLGDVVDHGLDLIHPPFWWWAWWAGAGGVDLDALVVVLSGYLLLRAQEGIFLKLFGMELHVWQRFDSRFRLVTARRNPILAILTLSLLAGIPAEGMRLVAAWTLVSLAVHSVRILMAARAKSEGGTLSSWLE